MQYACNSFSFVLGATRQREESANMNMLFSSTARHPPAPIPRLPPPASSACPLPPSASAFPRSPISQTPKIRIATPPHPSLAFPALPMPSKRPSAHAAMDAAARLRPSPPRSKKRSSRAKPRAGDRRRSPNPNPSSRRDHGASAPSRKSDRKRKLRSFADSASLAMAIAAPASSGSGGGQQKLWTDADEVALLTGAAAFRARHGAVPRLPDMGALFESLRGSLSPHLDQAKVYYKLKRLKSKFLHSVAAATSSPHEHRVRDLSADLWGAELAPPVEDDAEAEEGDADEGYVGGDMAVAVRLPVVSEVLGEYWRRNARALSGVSLEKGLALLRAGEGRVVETKWRRQLDAEMRTQVRQHDLATEVYGLLIDAVKGLGP